MNKSLCLLIAALILSSTCGWAAADPMKWTNPIVPQRADPQVIRVGGTYYLAATVPAYDCIELRRASTLAELSTAEPKVVWRKHASGPMSGFVWAPELHRIGNKWYIYFTSSEAQDIWKIRLYVLENSSTDPFIGTWAEKGLLKTDWDSFTLDATTFEHRGTRYLAWAQKDPQINGNSNIYIAKMNSPLTISGKQVLLTKPELPWECAGIPVNEGPAVLIKNGRVFMTYSGGATDANYCLGMLTADVSANLLDPKSWKKAPEPVFKSNPETSQYGPGHNYFTTSPDGKTDILIYHDRNYEKIQGDPLKNPDRATRAQIIRWNPDGTPDFGVPAADGPYP